MLTLRYRLSSEEYFGYNYYTAWSAPWRKRYRLWYYMKVISLYSVITILYIISRRSSEVVVDFAVFAIIAIIYFLLVPILIKQSIRRRVKQTLTLPENKHILGDAEVILDDLGITDKDAESESRYKWEAVVKKAETQDSYYLYTNSWHAIVIPKRVLRNAQEEQELARLFDSHLSLSSEL